ncbi:hypothetical protein B0H63DRAFT_111972 [Podospora didyma]|uniref:Uncharacterized protein n=1 Tax=Podospora didyma TaxID=330526 RepID=A0AAE0U4N0_9PEZI|nr:hypothetical protein B0H63DRAFT_111972 [Podospora didyma]
MKCTTALCLPHRSSSLPRQSGRAGYLLEGKSKHKNHHYLGNLAGLGTYWKARVSTKKLFTRRRRRRRRRRRDDNDDVANVHTDSQRAHGQIGQQCKREHRRFQKMPCALVLKHTRNACMHGTSLKNEHEHEQEHCIKGSQRKREGDDNDVTTWVAC